MSVPGLTKDGRRISVEFTIVLLHDKGQTPVELQPSSVM